MSTSSSPALVRSEVRVTGALAAIFGLRMFGLFMLLPVFAVFGASLPGATPFLIGLAVGAYGLVQALLQLPFGMLSDRFGRRPLLVIGLLLFAAGGVVAACADTIYGVIAGRAIQGGGAVAAVIMALVTDVISEQHRTRAMAGIGMSVGGAFVLALIFGPLLASGLGLSGLFWLSTGLALLGLLVVLVWVPDPKVRVREAQLPLPQRLLRILRDPLMVRLNSGIFVLHALLTASFVVIPGVLSERLGLPLPQHSLLYLVVFLASFVAMVPLIIASERRGQRPVMATSVSLLILSLVMLALGGGKLWLIGAALWVFFTGFNALEALLPSLVGRAAPVGTRGTALGIYSSCQFLGVFVGGAAGGWLLQQFGSGMVFWAAAVLCAGWLVLVLGMPPLVKLESRVLPLPVAAEQADDWASRLLSVQGVLEAVALPEDGIALLKVAPAELDEVALARQAEGAVTAV